MSIYNTSVRVSIQQGPLKKFNRGKVKKLFRDRIISIIISYALF